MGVRYSPSFIYQEVTQCPFQCRAVASIFLVRQGSVQKRVPQHQVKKEPQSMHGAKSENRVKLEFHEAHVLLENYTLVVKC